MASEKLIHQADIHILAAEVMDLWQEHLAVYAADPKAKAELMQLLEPQRQLFADWATMMQNGLHGTGAQAKHGSSAAKNGKNGAASPRAATLATASDDGTLRLAQLAHRAAQLERHVAELEKRLHSLESGNRPAAGKTSRPGKSNKSGA